MPSTTPRAMTSAFLHHVDMLTSPRLWLAGALLTRRSALLNRAHKRLLQRAPSSIFRLARKGRCRGKALAAARLCYKAAELLRTEAERPRDLHAARALYRLAMCGGNSELRQDARERLLLMLFQSGKTPSSSSSARRLLAAGGFVGLLTPRVLNSREVMLLPRFFPSREDAPIMKQFDAVDNALPAGMLLALQRAFGPSSPFWTEHKYKCGGAKASPFFSYVHSLSGPPKSGFDRVIRHVWQLVKTRLPGVAHPGNDAKYCEWWAHCRPHGTGHQMHFDTDNEGHGGVLKHPIVSTALYLTGDAGGPTLVTTQRAGDEQLASAGYLCTPNTNRILMFDGTLLHAVLPGSGIVPGADEATASTSTTPRRISLMIAFWPSIRERPSPQPSAARPFPYKAVKGAAKFPKAGGGGNATWPALFDWPVANDAGGGQAPQPRGAPMRGPCQPVFEAVEKGGQFDRMPSYDEVWQCLC